MSNTQDGSGDVATRTIYLVKRLQKNERGSHYESVSGAFGSEELAREDLAGQIEPGRVQSITLYEEVSDDAE
jgi:hypothetical protein